MVQKVAIFFGAGGINFLPLFMLKLTDREGSFSFCDGLHSVF